MPQYLSSDHDPLFSVRAMARQSADAGGDRDQIRALCSPVPSFCGTADRHNSTGVFGSHVVLDHGGSGKQAARFPDLFQRASHTYRTARANARPACAATSRRSPILWLARPLPRPLSDTNGCLTLQKLLLPAGGHWQANRTSKSNLSLLEIVNPPRLAVLANYTATGRISQPWLASTGQHGYCRN